jgi:hypothetical protein
MATARISESLWTCSKRWAAEAAIEKAGHVWLPVRSRQPRCVGECLCRILAWMDSRSRSDGDLTDADADAIEFAAGWTGDPGLLARVLVETGWIDKTDRGMYWHDYGAYNGLVIRDRNKKRGDRLGDKVGDRQGDKLGASGMGMGLGIGLGTGPVSDPSQTQDPHPPSGGLPGFDHLGTAPAPSSSSPSSVSETSTSKAKGLHPLAIAWNEAVSGTKLRKVTKMTSARSSQIKARLADEPDFDVWARAFKAIVQSKFHRGVNDRGWTATFDYAMQAKSCGPWLDAARLEVSEPKPDPAAPLPDMAEREARYRANMARFAASGVGK